MDYFLHLLTMICIYSTLGISLNLICGYTGILSMSHAAFFGVGAYTASILSTDYDVPIVGCFIAAGGLSLLFGFLSGSPCLRVRGDFFVLITFSVQAIAYNLFNNLDTLTGGPMGITGIPTFASLIPSKSLLLPFSFALVFLAVMIFLLHRISSSPCGRTLAAIREDELLAQSFGKATSRLKVKIFSFSSGLAGMSGAFYSFYIGYIDPSSFTIAESVLILSIVIVGGPASVFGPVLGAAILTLLPEFLRLIGIPGAIASNIRQILYGIVLIAFVRYLPKGLLGEYDFGHNSKES